MSTDLSLDLHRCSSACSKEIFNGEVVFHKTWTKELKSKLRSIDGLVQSHLLKNVPSAIYRDKFANRKDWMDKELRTWELWAKEGYNVPELKYVNGNDVYFSFIVSESYEQFIERTASLESFEEFVQLYSNIRQTAREKKEVDFLHSDPHLGNFLYSSSNEKEFYLIDSGVVPNYNLSFDEIDIDLVMFTLSSIANLKIRDEQKKEATYLFSTGLNSTDKEKIKKMNCHVPIFAELFFSLREELAYRYKQREKKDPLKELKNFNTVFNTYMRDILTK